MYSLGKISILIIDDNIGDQLILAEEIRDTALDIKRIVTAATFAEAKTLIAQKNFSLIFLDLFLPDSRGLDSFKDLQKEGRAVPIIIFSGLADKKIALKAISLGAQDFLIKGEHTVEMLEKSIAYSIERKKNLEIIKANNERHETLLKVTNDILWDWDMVTNKVSWSGFGINKYLPAGTVEIPANFWLKGLHPDERRNVVSGIYENVENGQNEWYAEYRFLKNNGEYDYIYSRGYIMCSAENLPVRMIGSMQDITEKRLADKKLNFIEKRFKSLNQNSSDVIALIDKDGNYVYVSESIVNALGYQPDFFLGKSMLGFIHPHELAEINSGFLKIFTAKIVELPPFRILNGNNQWRWLQASLKNMLNEPSLEGIIVNAKDITSRIEAEQMLKEATLLRQKEVTEAMIEGQENERTEIGRELHDNINQLLVASKLFIEMGMRYEKSGNDFFANAVTYVKGAIEEIRKLSKTLITPEIKEAGFIESVKGFTKDIMHVAPVVIKTTVEGFKPENFSEKFKLNIYRIVQEQVNNIIKHAKAKNVHIIFQQARGRIAITIKDDGIGFDTGIKKRGVGISNIFSRAALYKGNVSIKSTPGNGCNMSIVFKDSALLAEGAAKEVMAKAKAM